MISFGGIGMGMESVGALIKTIEGRKVSKERWEKTKVLIIDESKNMDPPLSLFFSYMLTLVFF